MSSDVAIKVSNVSKYYHVYDKPLDRLKQSIFKGGKQFYKEFKALDNVSFEVRKGETIGIIGKNGSGKSTLLQMVSGILTPSSGDIQIYGRVAALLELGAGFNLEFTGKENVYLNAALLGLSQDEIDDRYEEIVAFADIGDFISQPVKTYSSGMYVRLAFSIQASVEPEIMIVDEALSVGDAQFVHRCMLRFHELQEKGTTILFVSHDSSAVKRLCGKALWLRDGCIAAIGNSSDVVDEYLKDSFGLVDAENKEINADTEQVQLDRDVSSSQTLEVPSNDGRIGKRLLEIVGMNLLDAYGETTNIIGWNETISLLLEIKNNNLPSGQLFNCGYIVRDSKGIEIASSNTRIESVSLDVPDNWTLLRVLIDITIPMLHPGNYSLTASVSSVDSDKGDVIQDRVQNAYIFEVSTNQEICTPIRFDTRFTYSYV